MQTPSWLKKRLTFCSELLETKKVLSELDLNTVCESSLCPNLNECYSSKKATFLILGKACTRACAFCAAEKSMTGAVDPDEPARILEAVQRLGLKYAVVTSVTRDDLSDGGASQFVKVIERLKKYSEDIKVEVLIPDFGGNRTALDAVLASRPDIFGHNIEMVRRLYPAIRPAADYDRSLSILKLAKILFPHQLTKSSLMLGLGEVEGEIAGAMSDIRHANCDILTIGQYLRPGPCNIRVDRFVTPEEFTRHGEVGKKMGFRYVAAGPFVRSSYLAEEAYKQIGENYDRSYAAAVG